MTTPLSPAATDAASYVRMRDRIMTIAWCLDRADADGVARCFTADGTITTADGKRFEGGEGVRRFVVEAARNPSFRGRQHHVKPLFAERTATGAVWTSYYQLLHADAAAKAPELVSLGYYRDVLTLHEGEYLLTERTLYRWNSELAPTGATPPANPISIVGRGAARTNEPELQDRLEMEALMKGYAASLDTGDVDRMIAVFAPGGILNSGGLGRLVAPAGLIRFLAFNTKDPAFGGRQHRIFPLVFEPAGAGWRAFSYWKVETWAAGTPPRVVGIGYYEDVFEKHGGKWLIASKTIRRWNSETAPMANGIKGA